MTPRDPETDDGCTCWAFRNRKVPYDPKCPFHGDNGTMVVKVDPKALVEAVKATPPRPPERLTGGLRMSKPCPHCGREIFDV